MQNIVFTSYDLWLSIEGYPNGLRLNPNDGSSSKSWGKQEILDSEPSESRTLEGPITMMKWEWKQDGSSKEMLIAGFEITTDACVP